MKANKFHVKVENGTVFFPDESFPIDQIAGFEIDHRAFTCTAAFVVFLAGSIACMFYMPEMIVLVAGCFFVWLRLEYSRYVELKVRFKDGSIRRVLSCSFGEREYLYALDNSLKKHFPVKKK